MQSRFFPTLTVVVLVLFVQIHIMEALQCYQMNQQMTMQNQWYQCPAQVSQCFKFVCAGPTYYINKGCMDINDPRTNCQTMQAQCQGQGGIGTCYTCSRNKCNAAVGTGLSALGLLTAIIVAIGKKMID